MTGSRSALSLGAGFGVAFLGSLVLFAWAAGIGPLASLYPPFGTMKPNTALCLVALGLCLASGPASDSAKGGMWLRASRIALSSFAVLLGLVSLIEHAMGRDLGIDSLLFKDGAVALQAYGVVRISQPSTLALILLGLSLGLRGRGGRRIILAQSLASAAAIISLVVILSYAYSVHAVIGTVAKGTTAFRSALCFIALSVGIFALDPDKGLALMLKEGGAAGKVARRLLPAAILVPSVIAGLKLAGDKAGLYDPAFGVLLVAAAYMAIFSALGSWIIGGLAKVEGQKALAEGLAARKDALLSLTSEIAKVGGWEFDVVTGEGDWTEEVARIHGLDPEAPTSRSLGLGFYEGASRPRIEAAIAKAVDQAMPYDLELDLRSADGKLKRVRTIGIPVVEGGRVVRLRGIFQDVTELRRAQESLRQSEERFSTAFASSPMGQSISTRDEGRIIDVNEAYCEIIGYSRGELVGRTSAEMGLFADAERRGALIAELSREGSLRDARARVRTKAGGLKEVELSMAPISLAGEDCLIASVVDISERLEAERALRESEERYRGLFENMIEGFCYCRMEYEGDLPSDFTYLAVNPAFSRLTGIEGVVGRRASEVVSGIRESDPDFFAAYERIARTRAPDRFEIEVRALGIWLSLSVYFPAPGYFVAVFDVITERKRAEAEILKLNAELEDRIRHRTAQLEETNAELESFSYSVSHDLRSPLRGIDGWSAAIQEEFGEALDPKAQGYLARVRSESQRMGALIDSLLQLARVGRAELNAEDLDLSELSSSIAARMRETYPGRDIEFVVAEGLRARADRKFIEIALVNLFDNACKFTSRRQGARVEFGRSGDGSFYVRDNGAGFDMAYAQKLFAPFQRMHKASDFPGTGIGLATVHRIMTKHGGRVWAEARAGEGAAFHFTLGEP